MCCIFSNIDGLEQNVPGTDPENLSSENKGHKPEV